MKRYYIIFVSILAFFLGTTAVEASSLLTRKQLTNGSVDLAVTTEEGYVGAIDVAIQITGNVSLKNIKWDSSLESSYTKEYRYQNGILHLYLATGNVKKNLADRNRQVKLATVTVSASTTTKYDFQLQSLSVVKADYSSVSKYDFSNNDKNEFTYQKSGSSSVVEGTAKPNQEVSRPNLSGGQGSGDAAQATQSAASEVKKIEKKTATDKDKLIAKNVKKNQATNKVKTTAKKPIQDKKQMTSTVFITIIMISMTAIVVGGSIYFYLKKKKRN